MGLLSGRASARAALCCATLVALLLVPARLWAQSSTLTVTSGLSFAAPTVQDYINGYVCVGSISAAVTTGTPASKDALLMQLGQTTAMVTNPVTVPAVTKPLTDFQYTTSPGGCVVASTWTAVPSASAVTLHAAATEPYTVVVYFRLKLAWTTDLGGRVFVLPVLNVFLNSL